MTEIEQIRRNFLFCNKTASSTATPFINYIANNKDPDQTASLVNISSHKNIIEKIQSVVHLNV